MQMAGSTIVVTGGGTGIGRGLAEALHQSGNKVIVAGRRKELLETVAHANPGIDYLRVDLADSASIDRFSNELTRRYPHVDVLINNAGIQQVEDLSRGGGVEAAEAAVAVNLLGPIRLTATLLPTLLAKPHATIVNVTSSLAFVPNAAIPSYSAAKAALHSYTQSLRFQLRHTGVDVVEIVPSQVVTPLLGEREPGPTAMSVDDFVDEVMTALRKPGCTEIVLTRAKRLRHAERDGAYQSLFDAVNSASP